MPATVPNYALRYLRREAKLSLGQLAEMAGVSPAAISRIENGHRNGHADTLRRLAAALAVPAEQIGGVTKTEAAA